VTAFELLISGLAPLVLFDVTGSGDPGCTPDPRAALDRNSRTRCVGDGTALCSGAGVALDAAAGVPPPRA